MKGMSIKAMRVNNGWRAEDIAEQLGVSVMTYRNWENGKHLRLSAVKALAELYGVSPMDIQEAGLKETANEGSRVCEKVGN